MNFKLSSNGADEIEVRGFKVPAIPPPSYFCCLKRVLVCFALVFFAFTADAGAQVTCPSTPNDKQLLVSIKDTLDPTGMVLNWSNDLSTTEWNGEFTPSSFSGTTRVSAIIGI